MPLLAGCTLLGWDNGKGIGHDAIEAELEMILEHRNLDHVILIDDARYFLGREDYPTLEQVEEMVTELHPGWFVRVGADIIRIHP